ncbi:hypothetical protein [uncultured Jannaschia sp.]|uniref:hypothetical protein n=1 Tax=uncultured Jannaschia sp. TaxID=293347 RepID=UPI00260AFBA3|nr:hypothetical protein [uncultured Jannaschia sp.]
MAGFAVGCHAIPPIGMDLPPRAAILCGASFPGGHALDLIAPLIALVAVAWLVPWLIGRCLPEGAGWLVVNGALAALVLTAIAGVAFVWLYGAAVETVWHAAPGHFVTLALRSALIWAPVMVLSLANLPRNWSKAVW